jgi:hypothetical protein
VLVHPFIHLLSFVPVCFLSAVIVPGAVIHVMTPQHADELLKRFYMRTKARLLARTLPLDENVGLPEPSVQTQQAVTVNAFHRFEIASEIALMAGAGMA